jgi:hypothetical protein
LEGLSVSATLVTSVVLLFSDTNIISPKYITALFAANIKKTLQPIVGTICTGYQCCYLNVTFYISCF